MAVAPVADSVAPVADSVDPVARHGPTDQGRAHGFMGRSGALQGLFRAARQNVPYKFPIRHLRGSAVPGFSGMAATPERD